MKASDKAMISTYINSAIAAAVALYMSGNTDPNDLLGAAIAAVAPLSQVGNAVNACPCNPG